MPLLHFPQVGYPFSLRVTGVLIPTRLMVNGQVISPPTSQAVPAVVSVLVTPTANGTILPLPPFTFVTDNAPAPQAHIGQSLYASYAAQGDQWISLAPPFQGTPPRLVLGTRAVTMRFIGWVARPTAGNPLVTILWVGTPSGKPGGVIATTPGTPTGSFSLDASTP